MSQCKGTVSRYGRGFSRRTNRGGIACGVVHPDVYLCEGHLAERQREELAKVALEGKVQFVYHSRDPAAPPDIESGAPICADADRDRLGLPERSPERVSYWDDLFRPSREQQVHDLEAVARNEAYPRTLRLKARSALEEIAIDEARAGWLRTLVAEVLARIDTPVGPFPAGSR